MAVVVLTFVLTSKPVKLDHTSCWGAIPFIHVLTSMLVALLVALTLLWSLLVAHLLVAHLLVTLTQRRSFFYT